MNNSDMVPPTTVSPHTDAAVTDASDTGLLTALTTQAHTTLTEALTTAAPTSSNSTVVAVVVVLILLTVAALVFLLYRYLCHNKGDYRTTGELAPGEDPDEEYRDQTQSEKKEYFI